MKTMKLMTAVFITIAFATSAFAQYKTDKTLLAEHPKATIEYEGFNPTFQDIMAGPDQTGFHIGARYQPVFGSVDFNTPGANTVNASMQASHGFAVSFNYYFNNMVGTHLEGMWSRQQFQFEDDGRETTINLSYLSFPLMASLNTNYGKWINFNVAAGPYVGINTGADANITGEGEAQAVLAVNPLDIGVAYGGGVDFAFGETNGIHLRVGYRGTTGLLDLQDSRADITENQFTLVGEDSNIQTHGIYLGIMFKL
ncbi:MAG: PorT family protein [Bacteroidota bacterium]|nr:PorT family protein [Bacteroidota bacterium]